VADRNTKVWCWGLNSHGQVSGPTEGGILSPREVLDLGASESDPVFSVSAGGRSSCAVLASGTLRCWGRGVRAHLGDAVEDRNEQPLEVGVSEVAVVVVV
jgi:hypothetical protein